MECNGRTRRPQDLRSACIGVPTDSYFSVPSLWHCTENQRKSDQKRKKEPWLLFSYHRSVGICGYSIFGAGNETLTRRVSRCFPNTFFAEVTSEDLNCSLVLRPRQRVRPKKSIDIQGRTLSAPDPHPTHRHPHSLELATHLTFSASASSPRCRLGSRLPMSGQLGCHRRRPSPRIAALHLRKPRRKDAHPGHDA